MNSMFSDNLQVFHDKVSISMYLVRTSTESQSLCFKIV
jgi:hypothetical protein